MPIAALDTYASTSVMKARLGITDTTDDATLFATLAAVSRAVDGYCDDYFGQISATNYYESVNGASVQTDSIVSVSELAADMNGDGTYENVWTASTDYVLRPRNAPNLNEPYTEIMRMQFGSFFFPLHYVRDGVRVTGVFGWPAVPAPVKEVTLLEAGRLWNQSKAPMGALGVATNSGGGDVRILPDLHPTSKAMLHHYVSKKLRMA